MPKVIVIDGIIGSGKTTILKLIEQNYYKIHPVKICCIYEPVNEWQQSGILDEFYKGLESSDPNIVSLTSYKFQSYAYLSRIENIKKGVERIPDADIYFLERSIYSDRYFFLEMLHDSKLMMDKEYDLYMKWWRFWKELLPIHPTHFIYITPPVEMCMERIATRNRIEEEKVDPIYQQNLKRKHDDFFSGEEIILDGNKFPVLFILNKKNIDNSILQQIHSFLFNK